MSDGRPAQQVFVEVVGHLHHRVIGQQVEPHALIARPGRRDGRPLLEAQAVRVEEGQHRREEGRGDGVGVVEHLAQHRIRAPSGLGAQDLEARVDALQPTQVLAEAGVLLDVEQAVLSVEHLKLREGPLYGRGRVVDDGDQVFDKHPMQHPRRPADPLKVHRDARRARLHLGDPRTQAVELHGDRRRVGLGISAEHVRDGLARRHGPTAHQALHHRQHELPDDEDQDELVEPAHWSGSSRPGAGGAWMAGRAGTPGMPPGPRRRAWGSGRPVARRSIISESTNLSGQLGVPGR